jgi:hypothetical protein
VELRVRELPNGMTEVAVINRIRSGDETLVDELLPHCQFWPGEELSLWQDEDGKGIAVVTVTKGRS